MAGSVTCAHCERPIELNGIWVDPEATGDDSVWRETCQSADEWPFDHQPEPESLPDFTDLAAVTAWLND